MSGICGIYGKGDVEEMARVLRHRGPDDTGYYMEGPFSLGVKRLAIIDVKGGYQPLSEETQKTWVALDGDIFNYSELKLELKYLGHEFKTRTDTEVVVHAWEQWGPACLDRFNGQFALAIWDGEKIHLARDRMGEKPLYYYQRGGRLLFASEIKSILTEITATPRFTDEFRDFEAPLFGDTLFANVRELQPGHRLSFDGKDLELVKWWEVPTHTGPYKKNREYVDELRWLLEDSVKLRMKGDVPVAVMLSGGLDSSCLACLAKTEDAYAVSFSDAGEAYDELVLARMVAEKAGSRLHVIRPKPADLKGLLPGIIYHLDQPVASASSLAAFMAARKASKRAKAVLIGQGADELFGGHVRYLMMLAEDRLGREEVFNLYLPLARHFWNPQMFCDPPDRYYSLMSRGPGVDPKVRAKVWELFSRHEHLIDKMGYADLHLALPSVLAMDDRATAAFGIENRNPFLDYRVVEFAFKLPPALKVDGLTSKVILRRAMKGIVPEAVLQRADKMGLVVPLGHWIKKGLKRWSEVRINRFKERYETNFLNAAWEAAGDRGEFDRREYMQICLETWFDVMIAKDVKNWDKLCLGG